MSSLEKFDVSLSADLTLTIRSQRPGAAQAEAHLTPGHALELAQVLVLYAGGQRPWAPAADAAALDAVGERVYAGLAVLVQGVHDQGTGG